MPGYRVQGGYVRYKMPGDRAALIASAMTISAARAEPK
jgi:hypothetical protein